MICKDKLESVSYIAPILTPVAGFVLWSLYQFGFYRKRKKLEAYLKNERDKAKDQGQRSLLHLMVHVGLTESELLQASYKSRHIKRLISPNQTTGRAEAILLQYVP